MSERYSRLFALPNDLYVAGSPVVIAAGALLKDNQTNKVLAQLKFRSINPKHIKAIKVSVLSMDTVGRTLGEAKEHQYLDLSASRGAEFGQKTAIPLADASTRSFSVAVTEVAFADNSIWTSSADNWQRLPTLTPLMVEAQDEELVKQYQLTYGKQCRYSPLSHEDLWFCSCGAVNRVEESTCHACNLEYAKLNAVQWAALKHACDERLAAEKAWAERQAAERAKKEAEAKAEAEKQEAERKKQARRKCKIAIIVFLILAVVISATILTIKVFIPASKYANAEKNIAAGKYDEAIALFTDLSDYKDAAARIPATHYLKADALLADAQYDEAISIFSELGIYSDSETRHKEAIYAKASSQFSNGNFVDAADLFESLYDYSDSKTRANESWYQQGLVYFNEKDFDNSNAIFKALGNYKDSSEKLHYHKYSESVTLEPGHEAPGIKTFVCSCEASYTEEIKPLGHNYESKVTTAATCTVPGVMTYTCDCGASYTDAIPAAGHSYSSKATTTAATCTAPGVVTYSCKCGASYTEAVSATGHSYSLKTTTAATCEKDGAKLYSCRCGDSYSESIKATGHSFSTATCTAAAKCKNCGKQQSPALGHTASTGVCGRCGYNCTPPINFSNSNAYSISTDKFGNTEYMHKLSLPKGKYKITVTVNEDPKKGYAVWVFNSTSASTGGIPAYSGTTGKMYSKVYDRVNTYTFTAKRDLNEDFCFCDIAGTASYSIVISPIN